MQDEPIQNQADSLPGAEPAPIDACAKKESIWSVPYVILLAANFFQSMASLMVNTILPLYVDQLGGGAATIGFVVASFAITALLIRPFAGPAFDSFSRKRLLMLVQGINALSMVLYSFAESIPVLIAIRLLHGIGIGCSGSLAIALVSDFLPASRFASGISVYSTAQTLAQVLGPAVGLWAIDAIGFRSTSLTAAVLLVVTVVSISFIKAPVRQRPPYQLKFNRMFAREALDKALVIMLFAAAFSATGSYLALYAGKMGVENIGLYFTVYAACLLVMQPLFGRLADRIGAQRVLIPGVLCFAASYFMLAHVQGLAGFLAVAVVAAAGFGSSVPLINSLAMASVPPERRGSAGNTTYTGMDIGMLLGPVLAGTSIETLEPIVGSQLSAYAHMWYVMIIPQAIAFLVILAWNLRKR